MFKAFYFFIIFLLTVSFSSCASRGMKVKNVTYKASWQDRPRVDQEMPNGEPPPAKKTRKVFVVEVTKDNPQMTKDNAVSITPSTTTTEQAQATVISKEPEPQPTPVVEPQKINLPSFEDTSSSTSIASSATQETSAVASATTSTAVTLPADYVVEKDDTLQKISKKFYGSFGKWVKIYEANKEVLKDANNIKPGTKITIPSL